jgi:hypothetical protein
VKYPIKLQLLLEIAEVRQWKTEKITILHDGEFFQIESLITK